MQQVVIENPILNSPFCEPTRHFRFTDEGITNEVDGGRRISSYFVPIARPKKKRKQRSLFETEWTQDRIEENRFVNEVRCRVSLWRKGGYLGVTPTKARLLTYGTNPDREKKLDRAKIIITNFHAFQLREKIATGKIAVKVINHYGDEVLKVFDV